MSALERVELETAFLLHARAYRETSQILELFSQRHGRVAVVARGARRPKSRWASVLQPFQPLRVSWAGRGELGTLHAAESATPACEISGNRLMAGFYINELVLVFTRRGEAHPDLFAHYTAALSDLRGGSSLEAALRGFEIALLAEVGYGLSLDIDADSGAPLRDDVMYQYIVDRGPVAVRDQRADGLLFSGSELRRIHARAFDQEDVLHSAKRLVRAVLRYHLHGRELKTRRVLAAMRA